MVVNRYSNVEAFFKTYLDVDNDRDIFNRIKRFRMEWATKRIDSKYSNLDFLSGITIGVQNIRFSSLDESRLANECLRIDLASIQDDFYRVEGVVKEWNVSSNIIFQSMLYLIRYVLKNNMDLDYLYECYYVMSYKMLSSMISHRFKNYSADPRIAAAVVEEMSDKFILKELGSWQNYLKYRAEFLLPGTKHADRLLNSYNTVMSILIINDIQGNIKSTINRIYNLVRKLSDSDVMVDVSRVERMENDEMVLANLKSYTVYTDTALRRINSGDFVDDNLIYLISEISSNLNQTQFKTMLSEVEDSLLENFDRMNEIVRDTMKLSIQYIIRADGLASIDNSILGMIKRLKSYYSSSTVRDPAVVDLKNRTMELVQESTNVNTSWMLTSMNINFILYIVLVGLVKK